MNKQDRDLHKGIDLYHKLARNGMTIAAIREQLEKLATEDEWDEQIKGVIFADLPRVIEEIRDHEDKLKAMEERQKTIFAILFWSAAILGPIFTILLIVWFRHHP